MQPDVRSDLARLADSADAQGRRQIAAICRRAVDHIDALDREQAAWRARRSIAPSARAKKLTPERRREIAVRAAAHRWHPA